MKGKTLQVNSLLTLFLVLTLVLAACGRGGNQGTAQPTVAPTTAAAEAATPTTAAVTEPITETAGEATTTEGTVNALDFNQLPVEEGATLRFSAAGNTTEQQLYQQGAERFNEIFADQNVTLTFEPVPSEYETTITAGFAGGNAPDVFLLNGQLAGQLAPQGLLLPLDEAINTVGRQTADFYEPLIEVYQFDGVTYGLPKDFNPLVLFINTELAEQAGVDPASIQSWEDLQAAAEALTQGEGAGQVTGLCFDPNILRFAPFFFQQGNPIIEDGQAVFNQEGGVAALQFWQELQESGAAGTYQDLGTSWCGEAFAQGVAAMVIEGGWLVPFMADPQQGGADVQYTAVPLPRLEGGSEDTILFTNAFAANANTPYPNAAAAAVLFLTSEVNQEALIPTGLAQPSLQALADNPYYQDNPVASTLVQAAQNGRVAETVFGGPERQADVIRIINQSAIEPIFVGNADIQEALNQAAEEINAVLQQ
jgi:multiple sugar transport system substrate-binding protein